MTKALRVLIVEADACPLIEQLRRGGYEPSYACVDSLEAMGTALDRENWDIVLSDNSLPSLSASEVLELIRSRGLDLPVIVVSEVIGEEEAVAMLKAGAHDVLRKDNLSRLVPAIERALREVRARAEHGHIDEALRESEERFRLMADSAPVLLWMAGTDTLCTFFNKPWLDFTGRTLEQEAGNGWTEGLHPDDFQRCLDTYLSAFEARRNFTMEYRLRRRDGEHRWVLDTGVPRFSAAGEFAGYIGSCVDITERKHAEERLADARLSSLVRNASDIITVVDAEGIVVYQSPAVNRVLGYDPEELVGRSAFDFVHAEDSTRLRETYSQILSSSEQGQLVEYRYRHRDGSWRHIETTVTNLLDDPTIRGVVANSRDITERKRLVEQLEHRAFHDPLTELPNRALFMDRLDHALARAGQRNELVAVLFLDLDGFKAVNDSFGHEAGDHVLIAVAKRLRACLRGEGTSERPSGIVSRLGGDEFTILLEGLMGVEDAAAVAWRVMEALRAPLVVQSTEIRLSTSIGIALGTPSWGEPAELLREADRAMYKAKNSGKALYEIADRLPFA